MFLYFIVFLRSVVRKVRRLREVQKRMAGKLPQWSEPEGKADDLAEREAAEAMEKLRESARTPSWSGARDIRMWRDTRRKP